MKKLSLIFVFVAFLSSSSFAAEALDARQQALFQQIRCVVCQSQSLNDSNAPMAQDMKAYIAQQIEVGKTDAEIKADLVAKYGESVLMAPQLNRWIWFLPLGLLLGGALLIKKLR